MEDTISAIVTAPGKAAVGIVRISGEKALDVARQIFCAAGQKPLTDHVMVYGHIKDEKGRDVDEVFAVYMKAPRTYTAEDVVEIQCHGGSASLRKILALTFAAGARMAEPGEFTKRAFLNGRLDLAQAEAVMDIISARSGAALAAALRTQEGFLSKEVKKAGDILKDVLVRIDAVIDYPEDDIEDATYQDIDLSLAKSAECLQKLLKNSRAGRILKDGLRTVIAGRPNAGKSSLLNRLLKEERAIVSKVEGTTRDVIEDEMTVAGVPVILADTAGIRETEDEVEKIGVERSLDLMEKAELILAVIDGSSPLTADDERILSAAKGHTCLVAVNKMDIARCGYIEDLKARFGEKNVVEISARTGEGTEDLLSWLEDFVYGSEGAFSEHIFSENERHIDLIQKAAKAIEAAQETSASRLPYDCVATDMREALSFLGEVTGETVKEEIINEIFARFCVGK